MSECASLLSIVIPVYNASETLSQTLASLGVIATNHRDRVQVICSDDGSTDHSAEIIRQFTVEFNQFQWTVVRESNAGVSAARNRALSHARGRWLFFLDADDELNLDPTEHLLQAPAETTMLCFKITRRFSDASTKTFPPPSIQSNRLEDLLSSVVPLHICACFCRRSEVSVPFDEELTHLEDWMFWWQNRTVFRDIKRVITPQSLAIVHVHGHNRTSEYEATGAARALLAHKILKQYDLSTKQANNMKLQHDIGMVLQDATIPLRAFTRFPCSPLLWMKLVTYWAFGRRIGMIHPYRRPQS